MGFRGGLSLEFTCPFSYHQIFFPDYDSSSLSSCHIPQSVSAFCHPLSSSVSSSLNHSYCSIPKLHLFSFQPDLFWGVRDLAKFTCRSRQQAKALPVKVTSKEEEEEEEEVEEEISWIQQKAEDFTQMTRAAINTIPGPRVGQTFMPWLVAVPVGYLGVTFVFAAIKTIRKFNSPKEKRRRLVMKNASLCKSLEEFLPSKRFELDNNMLKKLESQTKFDTKEILRKYIRYALNERPFNLDLVADLIHLRKTSQLEDMDIAEILNEVSHRIVKEKGPVVMDTRGFTEKGIKRKAALQALFCKLLYLAELDEFCPASSSLEIKEIFGVTDEDADSIRIETLSEVSDLESLEKMVHTDSEAEEDEDKKD